MAKRKPPKVRRQYYNIYAPVLGLKYDTPTTMLDNKDTPKCDEVLFRENIIAKAGGTQYFAQTNTYPLDGVVLDLTHFFKLDGTDKLICHTTTKAYYYDTATDKFVSLVDIPENVVSRATVLLEDSVALINSSIVLREKTSNIISRLIGLVYGSKGLVSRTTTLRESSRNFVSRGTVLRKSSSSVVMRMEVPLIRSWELPLQTTVLKEDNINLVSRSVVLLESNNNLVSRNIVLLETNRNLVSRTISLVTGSSNLVSTVTVTP